MKHLSVVLIALIFVSCGSSRVITSKEENSKYKVAVKIGESTPEVVVKVGEKTPEVVVTPVPQKDVKVIVSPEVDHTPANTTDKISLYVHKYKNIAQYEMQHSGVPASITLAQGILESGAGNGDLTKRANNHFGIKCHGWTGEKVYHDDDKRGECFRKYAHPSESFKDHSAFLTSRKRYASLFELKRTDYKGWAKGLRKAGYATDPKYPAKLISLIERYNLYEYDNSSNKVLTVPSSTKEGYKVQKGDTLYSIAKKFNLSVTQLMDLNNLDDSALNIGQQLTIQ